MSQIILTGEDAVRFAQKFFNPSLEQLRANEEAIERAMKGIKIIYHDEEFIEVIVEGMKEPWKGEENATPN